MLSRHSAIVKFGQEESHVLGGAPTVMTVAQVAKALRLHELTIRQLARDGEMPAFKVGILWRLNSSAHYRDLKPHDR